MQTEDARHVDELENEMINWNQNRKKKSLREITLRMHRLKRKIIELELDAIDDPVVRKLVKRVKLMTEYLKTLQLDEQTRNLRTLTFITTLGVPLSIIVGAFGMNFAFMGIDPDTKGVFRWKSAPMILMSLCVTTIVVVSLLFNMNFL